jgi:hypothetical protein
MSRRTNIDPEQMSHYFDRLDEEWTSGAREKVVHLLRSNDPSAHAAAILILSELATDFDLEELEEIVTDPTVSDIAKLSLSSVLRDLGSELADEGLVEYLNDPAAAVRQMQTKLLELVDQSEVGIESVLEDVMTMPMERRLAFIAWLGQCNDPRAARLLVPLLDSQPTKVALAVLEAIEKLGPVAVQLTIPALNQLASGSGGQRDVKQQARAVLGRLTMQSMLGAEDLAMYEARQVRFPAYEARVSFIDGSGLQLIMLSWMRSDLKMKVLNVLYLDQWGIKECYGVDGVDQTHWEQLARDMQGQEISCFQVPFSYACSLIMEAKGLNKRGRHKLPIAYAVWRPLVEAGNSDQKARSRRSIQPPEFNTKVKALAEHGAELYQRAEFSSWLYDSLPQIEPYIMRYWAVSDLGGDRNFGRKHRPRVRGMQRNRLLDELIDEAVQALVDEPWRERYANRLQRQAALFQFAQRHQDAELTNAVAAMLHPASHVPATEQPFLRAMLRLSIEQGPLRLMMDVLSSGTLESLPLELAEDS